MRASWLLMGLLLAGCFQPPGPSLMQTLPVPKLCALQLAPDGRRLALGKEDGEVVLLDEAGQTLPAPAPAKGRVRSMAFQEDKLAYCGLQFPILHLWDLKANRELASWPVGDLGKESERIEHHAILWVDSRTGHASDTSYAYVGGREAGEVTDLAWLNPQRLVVNDLRGRLSWWEPPQSQPAGSLPPPNPKGRYGYSRAATSPNGAMVAVTPFGANRLEIYQLPEGKRLLREDGLENLNALCFSPDSARLACASRGKVRVFQTSLGVAESEWDANAQKLCFSPNGKYLLAAGGTSRVWDLTNQKEVLQTGDCLEFLPLGSRPLAVALLAHGTRIFDLTTQKSIEIPGEFRMAAASPDGKRLYLATSDKLECWSIP